MFDALRANLPDSLRKVLRRVRAETLSLGLPRHREFEQPQSENEASGAISIIVAIHDEPEVVARCLLSLERYAKKAEVILVDDGSKLDRTVSIIDDFGRRMGWKIVRHLSPKGHSRSCEAGARIATCPYLCLLNSDTVVTPWSWRGVKEAFESDPNIAAVGPSTSWAATSQMISIAMHCRHYWSDSQICGFAERTTATGCRRMVDLNEVSGCAFFIRRQVWNKLGGFDPNLPDYGNESDLCIRLLVEGFRIVWTKDAYIHHLGRQSFGREGEARLLDRWRTVRKYIAKKHGLPEQWE
jgi:GT2 family glycosyltransferase